MMPLRIRKMPDDYMITCTIREIAKDYLLFCFRRHPDKKTAPLINQCTEYLKISLSLEIFLKNSIFCFGNAQNKNFK